MLKEEIYDILNGNDKIGKFIIGKTLKVEIMDGINPVSVPFDFRNEYINGQRVFNGKAVDEFIKDKIIPSGRQNLCDILREVGISEYDPLKIFLFYKGRYTGDKISVVKSKEN